jgi:hypothetical protein
MTQQDDLPVLASATIDALRLEMDACEFAELLDSLVTDLQEQLVRLPLSRGRDLRLYAYNLKGTAGCFGLQRLERLAGDLARQAGDLVDRRLLLSAIAAGNASVAILDRLQPTRHRDAA